MIIQEPQFTWEPNERKATCLITDGENNFYGESICHEDDIDMMSQWTGQEIAFRRASIKACQYYRNEIKIKLKALKQLYHSMNKSKYFNEKSYENKMLQRQIHGLEIDLATAKDMIAVEQQRLITYIQEKDKFYNDVRKHRKRAKLNND